MLGGAGCCNNGATGGAKKRIARKPVGKPKPKPKAKAKRGGNAGDTNPPTAEPTAEPVAEPPTVPAEPPTEDAAQSGGARKKKGSKVAAKRAPTPYNKFVKAQFAILKKKFPDDKAPQIMKKIAIEWKKTK